MSKALLAKLIPQLQKMRWPQNEALTVLGRKTYDAALDKVDMYHDEPKVLVEALRILQTGDSLPYAYAGCGLYFGGSLKNKDGSYVDEGLDAAMDWLEMAQEAAP